MEGWEPPGSCNVWLLLLSKSEKIYKFLKLKEGSESNTTHEDNNGGAKGQVPKMQ